MSNYTFLLPENVYRWIVSDQIIPNQGQANDQGLIVIPKQMNPELQNGILVANIITTIMKKSGTLPSKTLQEVKNDNKKQVKANNWNFIWLAFDQLHVQFDLRIKDLILQGQYALVTEILKQLYDRDQNKDQKLIKNILINQKPLAPIKSQSKTKATPKSNTLDIKKVNLHKNPNQSESSLQFLILLLSNSFNMAVEQILGLFTNQNKYLAHLIVKGINQNYDGVILFYSLLQKYMSKLKSFCENNPRDAQSCLYAIKPGMISKNEKVAQLTIDIFSNIKNIYSWFVSDNGRGNATLFLGMKRHPHLTQLYWNLLTQIIVNEEIQFFTNDFKKCFRDAEQMVEITTYFLPFLSNTFIKDKLIDIGVLQEWIQIGLNLFEGGNLQQKLISFRFVGAIMGNLPDLIEQNEDYLINLKKGWRQRNFIQYIHLIDEILLILEQLAGQKNTMARKVYQILIKIMDNVYDHDQKRQYLVRNFITVLPKFPKIPTQYLIQAFKDDHIKTSDLELILFSLNLSQDANCISHISEILVKHFIKHAVTYGFLAITIYKICQRLFSEQSGKVLTMKILKDILSAYANIEGSKKMAQIAKHQPMYFVQKGNQKYSKQDEQQFLITDKCGKNVMSLIEKLTDLVMNSTVQSLQAALKQQIMETNAIIKKNHYKTTNKALSNLLAKRFGVNRQQEEAFNEDFKVKKSLVSLQDSIARRKMMKSASSVPLDASIYQAPDHIKKQFDSVVNKRKQQEEQRKNQEERKIRQQALKKLMIKKEYQKTNLLRGFGQEAELKEDGFWSKFKQAKSQLQLYPPAIMEQRDVQYIQNLFKKYHKVLRTLFFKYTSSKYSIKAVNNFDDNKDRNQTLNVVEIIQFLKDFKFFFLTSKQEIVNLVRDLNVKLLNKRQTQQLDFIGFQQFIIQFCALIYTKTHTINANTTRGIQTIKKSLNHLSHLQLVEEWFNYLKLVFIEKGQKTTLFDQPQNAYFNQSEVIKEFTKKIQDDPAFILPEGYKKYTQKNFKLNAKLSDKNSNLKQSYKVVLQVLNEILFQSDLRLHFLEPIIQKQIKVRVKPHSFFNIKAKLMEAGESKVRALSSILDKKTVIPPVKMLEKKTLTLGMKLGLSYINYKDKLLGEQVAYVLDDMLSAVEDGRSNIQKQKIINQYLKKKNQEIQKTKFIQAKKQKRREQRKNQLQKMKKQIEQKKEKQQLQTKQERQKKKQKELSKQKKIKQQKEKYLEEQKNKIKQKKAKQEQQEKKKKQDEKLKNNDKKKHDEFQKFNQKQIEKFKKQFDLQAQKKKKQMLKQEQQMKKKQELVKKLRSKIHQTDKKAIELKQKTNQEIRQLYQSEPIKYVYKKFQSSIRALFDFLLRSSFLSITQKKNNSEITFETWHYFGLIFQLNPLIIKAKQLTKIFRHFTKDKQVHKDYYIGLTYQEFQQALLRISIKHKSIFNKLAEKIKDNMTSGQIDAVVQKDIQEKEKNEFEEPKQINVKGLIKEEDIKKDITDHYGDISKVNDRTLEGLIYYLKVPKDKENQQKRFRQILISKVSYSIKNIQQLRQKLSDEYSMPVPKSKKKKTEANESILNVSGPKQGQN